MSINEKKTDSKQYELSCACHNPVADILIEIIPKQCNNTKDKTIYRKIGIELDGNIIFTGGTIIPVVRKPHEDIVDVGQPAEAMGISDGKIISIGSLVDVTHKMKKHTTINHTDENVKKYKMINLDGKTLIPGFVEAHVHIIPTALMRCWNDYSPFENQALKENYNLECLKIQLQKDLKKMQDNTKEENYWLLGKGIDPALMMFPEYPDANLLKIIDKNFLDEIPGSKNIPILLISASMHTAYVNSAALDIIKIDNPELGDNDGVLQEIPQMTPAVNAIPKEQKDAILNKLPDNLQDYLSEANSRGITMMYDAGMTPDYIKALESIDYSNMRIGMAYLVENKDELNEFATKYSHQKITKDNITNGYFGNVKLISDGSNQGLTGYQSVPYCCAPQDNYGTFNYTDDLPKKLDKLFEKLPDKPPPEPPKVFTNLVSAIIKAGWPIMIHANGDQAVKYTIQAYENTYKDTKITFDKNFRNRIEHCSLLDDDDLDKIKDLNLTPSFLIGHVGYWGYAFKKNIFGSEKADKLDRCKSVLDKGIRISLHSDSDVTPLGPLRMMEQSITRIMEADPNKSTLNERECLTPEQALMAVTYDAAWQCHAQHLVGSLKPGNLADFVILEQNPLTMKDPYMKMRYIGVKQVWVGGKQVYTQCSSC